MRIHVKVRRDGGAKTVTPPTPLTNDTSNPPPAPAGQSLADRCSLTGLIDFCGKRMQPRPAKSLQAATAHKQPDLDVCGGWWRGMQPEGASRDLSS